MHLPRLLNSIADVYTALRMAGWSASEASKIVTEEATKAVNRLPQPQPRSYPLTPREEQEIDNEYHRYHDDPRRNQ